MEATIGPAVGLRPRSRPRSDPGKRRLRLLTRADLDGRTKSAQLFDSIERGIASDLGGDSELTTVERHLAHGFAGIAVVVAHLNARLLSEGTVRIDQHALAVSTMVRVASRLPGRRRAREISLSDYLAAADQAAREATLEGRIDDVVDATIEAIEEGAEMGGGP